MGWFHGYNYHDNMIIYARNCELRIKHVKVGMVGDVSWI